MFCNPCPQTKIGRAMGILLIPRFWSGSNKTVVEFLVLVRGNFFLYHLKPCLNGFILSHNPKSSCNWNWNWLELAENLISYKGMNAKTVWSKHTYKATLFLFLYLAALFLIKIFLGEGQRGSWIYTVPSNGCFTSSYLYLMIIFVGAWVGNKFCS